MGEGQEENAIVTSTGQYVIAWDFAKVKKGNLDKYEIKKYEDNVVQDNFKFGDDKEIVRVCFSISYALFPISQFAVLCFVATRESASPLVHLLCSQPEHTLSPCPLSYQLSSRVLSMFF